MVNLLYPIMKIRKFLSTVLIAVCVMSQSMPAYAWWGQHSGAGSDYYQTGPAISYDEFKTQINYRETKTLTEPSWRENILNSIGSAVKWLAEKVADLGRFIGRGIESVYQNIRDFFRPYKPENVLPQGYFTINDGKFHQRQQLQPISSDIWFNEGSIEHSLIRGQGRADDSAYNPDLYNYGNGAAFVDMPLNWFKSDTIDSGYLQDLFKPKAQSNRWLNSVQRAATDIAALIDSKAFKLIEVGGVNVEGGAGQEKINAMLTRLNIPANATLIISHSAGTHAASLAMSQITRNKQEVYWLLLSPRLSVTQSRQLISQAQVPREHVMSINNSRDFPHCVTVKDAVRAVAGRVVSVANPLLNFVPKFNKMQHENMVAANPFKAYDQAPWTHVWLERGIELLGGYQNKPKPVTMQHGTMFDSISVDARFRYKQNGLVQDKWKTVAQIINDNFFKERNERK